MPFDYKGKILFLMINTKTCNVSRMKKVCLCERVFFFRLTRIWNLAATVNTNQLISCDFYLHLILKKQGPFRQNFPSKAWELDLEELGPSWVYKFS